MQVRKWLPLAIMLGLAAAYVAPFLMTYSEQDDCTFGPVSNKQYLEYLSHAKNLTSEINSLSWRNQAKDLLNGAFEKLVNQQPSIYERIAAMHALLRALGAQYRNTNDMRYADPYVKIARTGGFVGFNYILDVNRIGIFSPIRREAWIAAELTGPGDFYRGPVPSVTGDIRFVVNHPTLEPRSIDRAPEQCPPVPDQTLSEGFSRIAR
jgi:hypothetical protein